MEANVERVLIPTTAILERLDELAEQILRDYQGKELTVVAVLNGSLIFAADLLRRIPLLIKLDCISASSYHGGTQSSDKVTFDPVALPDLNGRHVLILDDILDTGLTLEAIREKLLRETSPLSLKICVLLRKLKQRVHPVTADYVGFDIGDEFVIGYGLDYQEQYRNLPYIGVLADAARAFCP
jgi:hypoxanthine phosphoribosyltransferase